MYFEKSWNLELQMIKQTHVGEKLHEFDCERGKQWKCLSNLICNKIKLLPNPRMEHQKDQSPIQKLYGQGGVGGVLLP